jgi:hypothetical protein
MRRSRQKRSIRLRQIVSASIAAASVLVACGGGGDRGVTPADIGHVHDLVVDGDTLLVATHRGLFRLDDGSFRAVGDEAHDLMAMTMLPDGDLVASGHPDLRLAEYKVEGAPPYLGLARSSSGGESWVVVDLLGEADFHALASAEGGIIGADSTGRVWRFDAEGAGQPVGSIAFDVNDLAISPDDDSRLVATSYEGELAASGDAGQTWELNPSAPSITEIEWTDDGLTGASTTGQLWAADDLSAEFEMVGESPLDVETLFVDGAVTLVATRGGQIHRLDDDGSWTLLLRPDDG